MKVQSQLKIIALSLMKNVKIGCMNYQVVCFPKSIKVVEQIALKIAHRHITIIMMRTVINAALLFCLGSLMPPYVRFVLSIKNRDGYNSSFIICSMQKINYLTTSLL